MVLGRKTFLELDAFSADEGRTVGGSARCNAEFVASRTMPLEKPPDWNATLIEGDAIEGVRRLKHEASGDLVLIGFGGWRASPFAARAVDGAWLSAASRDLGR